MSFKGTSWKKHKYLSKKNGVYTYPKKSGKTSAAAGAFSKAKLGEEVQKAIDPHGLISEYEKFSSDKKIKSEGYIVGEDGTIEAKYRTYGNKSSFIGGEESTRGRTLVSNSKNQPLEEVVYHSEKGKKEAQKIIKEENSFLNKLLNRRRNSK